MKKLTTKAATGNTETTEKNSELGIEKHKILRPRITRQSRAQHEFGIDFFTIYFINLPCTGEASLKNAETFSESINDASPLLL